MRRNLRRNSRQFARLRRSYRQLYDKAFGEMTSIAREYGLEFDEINSANSPDYIMYRRDARLVRLEVEIREEMLRLNALYLALLLHTLRQVQLDSLETTFRLFDIQTPRADFEFKHAQTLAPRVDFNMLWQRNTKDMTDRLIGIVRTGDYSTAGRKFDKAFVNINFQLNRTFVSAINDTVNDVVRATVQELEIAFVKWSDYNERYGFGTGSAEVCPACRAMSSGGYLGRGIYPSSKFRVGKVALHPHCRCLAIPVVDSQLLTQLNELHRGN